jgi:hypothetical protein
MNIVIPIQSLEAIYNFTIQSIYKNVMFIVYHTICYIMK